MRIRRRLPLIFAVLVVAAVVALLVVLRKHAPPESARLLPSADGFVYVSLKWVRRANMTNQLPPVSHDPEYEDFIQATGFQFERDLEEVAFALHYPANTPGAKPSETRFSEVFVGKIQGQRLRAYLAKLSSSVESYRSVDIFNIPHEGRTVRVAILGVDTVAASNQDDPQLIRGIIDRSRKLASPFGGPDLLRQYYKDVPLASLGWTIFKVDPSSAPALSGPVNLAFLFSKPAVVIASVRYLGKVRLRAEAVTNSDQEAQHLTEQVGTFLSIFHSAENAVSTPGPDPDVKEFIDSLKIQQRSDRAVLIATIPPGFIHKALSEPPQGPAATQGLESQPAPKPGQKSVK